ncbi:MAG: PAS domain S-box protein, partial [Fidelibacterota bacterium]
MNSDTKENSDILNSLRASEERFRSVVESLHDMIFYIDEQGLFKDYFVPKIQGLKPLIPPDRFLGKHYSAVLPAPVAAQTRETIEKIRQGAGTVEFRYSLELSGAIRWFRATNTGRFDDGRYQGITCVVKDITERRKDEEVLRLALESVEYSGDAAYWIKPDGHFFYVNREACRELGYTREELLRLTALDITPHFPRDKWPEHWESLRISKKVTLKAVHRRKDGSEFPVEISANLVEFEGNEYNCAYARNITERNSSETRIRILSTGLEQSPAMVAITDTAWTIEYVNPRFEQVTGYSREEALGKNLRLLLEGDRATDQEYREIQAVVDEGKTWRGRFHNRRKDGTYYWESAVISPVSEPDGTISHLLNLKEDITAEVEARKQLEENEQRFRSVVEHTNDGLYILFGRHFLFVNRRFTELTGYSEAEVTQEDFDFSVMLTEQGRDTVQARIEAVKRGETPPSQYIFQGRTKVGEMRYYEVSLSPIDWDGKSATLGLLRDVTSTMKLQEDLQQALRQARQGEEIKRLFLANMSHEIRTPLNAIIGFTDLLQQTLHDRLSEEEQSFFDQVLDSGNRLIHTVHEIMDISQIEAGSFSVHIEAFNVVEVLRGVYLAFAPGARQKKLTYTLDCPEKELFVEADPLCIQRAFENLLDNAIKYPVSGSVTVRLFHQDQDLWVEFIDTGVGIGKKYKKRLFEPFSQESEGYTKKYQGVGLGLALTKKYLDLNS